MGILFAIACILFAFVVLIGVGGGLIGGVAWVYTEFGLAAAGVALVFVGWLIFTLAKWLDRRI